MVTRASWAPLLLAWLIAANLRTTFVGMSPVLPLIQRDLRITYGQAGVLFAVPVVLMGLIGLPGGWITDRLGARRVIGAGVGIVALSALLRAIAPSYVAFVLFTVVLGVGMGLAQAALPRFVKDRYPRLAGTATGIYATGYIAGATVASWLTTPVLLPRVGDLSWRGTFVVWAIPALLTTAAWLSTGGGDAPGPGRAPGVLRFGVWRSRPVWLAALLFLGQGTIFYTLASWLPTYLHESGLTLEAAAVPFTLFNAVAIPVGIVVPYLSDRVGRRRPFLIGGNLLCVIGLLGLLLAPLRPAWLWVSVVGGSLVVTFTLSLALPVDAAPAEETGSAAGFVLAVGYGGALAGPLLAGLMRDATGHFAWGLAPSLAVGAALVGLSLLVPETGRAARAAPRRGEEP